MKCFYHIDMDGKCAAAIIKKAFSDMERDDFIPINYNYKVPFERIEKDEEVFIVDFSFSLEDFKKLLEITSAVVWIDHHYTAIEKCKDLETRLPGIRNSGVAGCLLTWNYLFFKETDRRVPKIIEYLADYDTATDRERFTCKSEIMLVQKAMGAFDTHPCSDVWELWLDRNLEYMNDILHIGKLICEMKAKSAEEYLEEFAYERTWAGMKCLVCNKGMGGSSLFQSVEPGKYDIFMCYVDTGINFIVSMYSKTVDVGAIAKLYGGGGHKGAAGMTVPDLPWRLITSYESRIKRASKLEEEKSKLEMMELEEVADQQKFRQRTKIKRLEENFRKAPQNTLSRSEQVKRRLVTPYKETL